MLHECFVAVAVAVAEAESVRRRFSGHRRIAMELEQWPKDR